MEFLVVYVILKRKLNRNIICSFLDVLFVEKRAKEFNFFEVISLRDEDEVMVVLNLFEGVVEKFDLILVKLCSLDSKMEDLNIIVKSL